MMATQPQPQTGNQGTVTMQLTLAYRSGWWTAACPSIGVAARNRDRYKALIEVENQVLRTGDFLGLPAKALHTRFGMATAAAGEGVPTRTARTTRTAQTARTAGTAGIASDLARKPGRPRKALNPVGSIA